MAKLDSLIIDLQVNTAALKSGLDTAKSALQSFQKQVDSIKGSMEVMAGVKVGEFAEQLAGAFVHLTEQLVDFAIHGSEATEHIRELAEASGESIKEFSQLAFAAGAVGLGTDDLAKGLEKLDKNLGAAGAGVRAQAGLFNALGVAVKDSSGDVRSTDDVFKDLADVFSGLTDGASKTALAIKVFGKAGAEMIPFLNEGRHGIEELAAQAERLGITLTEKDSAAAHAFQSDLKQLEEVMSGVASKVATEVTPALTSLGDAFLKNASTAEELKLAVTVISDALKGVFTVAMGVAVAFDVMAIRTIGYYKIIKEIPNGVVAMASAYNNMQLAATKASLSLGKALDLLWGDTAKGPALELGEVTFDAGKMLKGADGVNASDEAMKALNKTLDEYNQKIAALSGGGAKDPIAEMAERLKSGDLSKELAKAGAAAAGMGDKLMEAAKTLKALTVAKIKIDFDITETARAATAMAGAEAKSTKSDAKTDAEAKQSTTDFNNIGVSPQALFKQLTAGFTSFGDALQSWTDNTKAASEQEINVALNEASAAAQRALAADLLKAKDLDGAAAAEAAAVNFTKAAQKAQLMADADTTAATASKKAADAFSKAATDFHATFENLSGGLNVLFQGLVSKMGKLGEVIQAGVQGFAQGGIWGALAAVIAEFITSVHGWSSVMQIGNGQFQMALRDMASGLGQLLDGLKDLMGGIEVIANAVHGVLSPILGLIGTLLKGLAPLFGAIGKALQPLGPIFEIIGGVLSNTLEPAFQTMGPILAIIDVILMGVTLAFQYVKLGLDVFMDWLKKAVSAGTDHSGQAAVDADNAAIYGPDGTIQKIKDLADAQTQGFLHGTLTGGVDSVTKDENDKAAAAGADGFNTPTLDATGAVVDFGSATGKATAALQKMTASLLNVPDGFKVDLRRFQAQSATNGTHGTGIGAVHNYNIGSVNLQAGNLDQLSDQLKKLAAKKRFHTTGAPGMP